ncbi:MAG: short-chain dehydrogenase [Gammaproteobacteria bacterium BRH_c0]|nr:MAG: short-chain dehydrogenase [Gammaproteobacteria bacterium BRH_c0]
MNAAAFRYDGKRVLVVGGATGMGAAAAQVAMGLGAEVIVMDVADVPYAASQVIKIDLRNRDSVEAAIGQIVAPVHAVFSCAGVADGVPGIMLINFISQRHIIDLLLARQIIGRGANIAMISSAAGLAWMQNLPQLLDFLATPGWDEAAEWIASHPGTDTYMFSKQAMCTYVARQAFPLLKQGIRINAVMPGPTDTPLARAHADQWLGFGAGFRADAGIDPLTPEQIGNTMAFLCSEAASGINGISLLVDSGHINAGISGAYHDPDLQALA